MRLAAGILALIGLCAVTTAAWPDEPTRVQIKVAAEPRLQEVPRIGLNLGQWTSWGAEQLSRNILKNPGFEGVIDRSLVRAVQVRNHAFSDDQTWLARPDGFWAGAEFTVLTGAAAGRQGRILDSRQTGINGLPEYRLRERIAGLAEGDIVAVSRTRDDLPPERWWLPEAGLGQVRVNPDLIRPGSPGRRSLGLHPSGSEPVRIHSHFDTISDRAGTLLPVQGAWRFILWVHGQADSQARLHLRFHRHGSIPFFDQTVPVQTGWHQLEIAFDGKDTGPTGPLQLSIEASGGVVHIDDAWLGPDLPQAEAAISLAEQHFSPRLIALLRQLQPGYLRDWQGQLGDSLDNRLAEPFARRTSRYRPGNSDFHYGLPEFMDLARVIGARPWLVMPTTFDLGEAERLGQWLAQQIERHDFDEIVVEFGNENWNAIFRPAGIQDPDHHGLTADRLFAALQAGAGQHPRLRTAINAQHANPHAALRFAQASQKAELLGLAPYFLNRADQADRDRLLERLFEDDQGRLDRIMDGLPPKQSMAVYEINLHTTRGDLPADERAALIGSPAAGIALAWHLLGNLERGITRQNVYRATGFDTFLEDRSALTPLFGIARDLGPPATLRPTGRALAVLNQAIGGDFHRLELPAHLADQLRGGAFRFEDGWTLLLVNRGQQPLQVTLAPLPQPAGSNPAEISMRVRLPGPALKQLYCRPIGPNPVAAISRCESMLFRQHGPQDSASIRAEPGVFETTRMQHNHHQSSYQSKQP